MVDEPVSPPAGVPERPPTTEASLPPTPSGEILAVPPQKSSRSKIVLAVLSLFIILASLPIAVYLVKQRQEIRKMAAPGVPGDMTCLSDVIIGPGYYSFVAKGVGLENRDSASFTINLPSEATPLSDYVYAFWSGEKKNAEGTSNGQITINGNALTGEKIYSKYNENWNNTGYIFRVKIPSSLITGTSLNFSISGLDLPAGVARIHGDEKGGAHGVGIVVPYEKAGLPTSKIMIRSCGDFVYHNKDISDDYSDPVDFSFPDISESGIALKAAFFFGEGEGDAYGSLRPNYLWYNNTTRLDPTDSTPYPGYSSDDGYWWDTRVTGEDLPAITASGTTASFKAHSPKDGHGDSFYFIGGILQYPITPPEELQCLDLTGAPEPSGLSPGDEITLTCAGSSDPAIIPTIDHFEFRVIIDEGKPVELTGVSTTSEGGEHQGQTTYTIPDYGCYKVECRLCLSSDSSECTAWGQAQ